VFAEPVLVCVSGPWYPREIYDQQGNLLAFTKRQQRDNRIQNLLRSGSKVDLFDIHGRIQLSSRTDRTWNPRLFTTTAPDGSELGTVTATGRESGLIVANGAPLASIRRPPGLLSVVLHHRGFTLYDADDLEVGHIRFSMTPFKHCRVVDLDHRASESLRANLLAVVAAVNYWEKPGE
jgi:hypothetical protein